jgi:hypothetical protein
MRRPLTFRLGTALAAFVFAATSGITGMEAHPLSAHGPHASGLIALDLGVAPEQSAGSHADHHSGHDVASDPAASAHGHHQAAAAHTTDAGQSGHSHHSSEECTCVGPCQGGAAPTISGPETADVWVGEADHAPVVYAPIRLIHQDPSSHLLPFATAPPARV